MVNMEPHQDRRTSLLEGFFHSFHPDHAKAESDVATAFPHTAAAQEGCILLRQVELEGGTCLCHCCEVRGPIALMSTSSDSIQGFLQLLIHAFRQDVVQLRLQLSKQCILHLLCGASCKELLAGLDLHQKVSGRPRHGFSVGHTL